MNLLLLSKVINPRSLKIINSTFFGVLFQGLSFLLIKKTEIYDVHVSERKRSRFGTKGISKKKRHFYKSSINNNLLIVIKSRVLLYRYKGKKICFKFHSPIFWIGEMLFKT